MKRALLAFVSVWSFAASSAPALLRAQTYEDVGIRAQGMGGAFVAVADDATATWWNPAGVAGGAYFNALIEYGDRDDGRTRGIAFGFPALGLSYYRLRLGPIPAANSTAASGPGRQDQGTPGTRLPPLDLSQYGATAGQSIGDHLVIASTLKLVRGADATTGDLDVGAMASAGLLRVGVTVRNVRAPELGTGDGAISLARRGRAGIAIMSPSLAGAGVHGINQVTLAFDAELNTSAAATGDERRIAGGGEAWLFGRRIGVRGGLGGSTVGARRGTQAAGLSVAVRSGIYLDGSITRGADTVRRGWGFAARVTF